MTLCESMGRVCMYMYTGLLVMLTRCPRSKPDTVKALVFLLLSPTGLSLSSSKEIFLQHFPVSVQGVVMVIFLICNCGKVYMSPVPPSLQVINFLIPLLLQPFLLQPRKHSQ